MLESDIRDELADRVRPTQNAIESLAANSCAEAVGFAEMYRWLLDDPVQAQFEYTWLQRKLAWWRETRDQMDAVLEQIATDTGYAKADVVEAFDRYDSLDEALQHLSGFANPTAQS